MMSLSELRAPKGSRHRKKRVGRGQGSGWGKTAGRGGKGQKARTGNMRFEGFEGGQMPLQRRLPKFGFRNAFRREFATVNIGSLEGRFENGAVIDVQALEDTGLLKEKKGGLKILGGGDLRIAITVKANRISSSAKAAIEKAGGTVELIADKVLRIPERGQGTRARIRRAK